MLTIQQLEGVYAGRTFAQVVGVTATDAQAMLDHGRDLLDGGASDNARQVFEGLVVLNPRDSGNWLGLAAAYEQLERYDDAVTAIKSALEADPKNEFAAKRLITLTKKAQK